jgi:hypothetical protein
MISFLKRHETIIQWIAGIGIPFSIILSSWLITASFERSKLDSDYVKIALGVLVSDKNEGALTPHTKALRGWAIRLLNAKSPVKFTQAEQGALQEYGLPRLALGGSITWGSPFGPIRMDISKKLKPLPQKTDDEQAEIFKPDVGTQF